MSLDTLKIKEMLSALTTAPGVYQMLDAQNKIIYVGKALNLKKRVSSYFQKNPSSEKLAALIRHIDHVKVIVTNNENEALVLESQLIKQHQPRYNILMRDDKSYPYIALSKQEIPRLSVQRLALYKSKTKNIQKTALYGPYPNTTAVRETVKLIQKIFKLRTCQDSFFHHRTRPCLLYQIKLCSAPCVNYITTKEYEEEVKWAKLLLEGRNQEVIENIVEKMKASAEKLEYETAAKLRNQIVFLRHIQTKQAAVMHGKGKYDVFAVIQEENRVVVELLVVREGSIIDNRTFYPQTLLDQSIPEILAAFLSQYYFDKPHDFPQTVLLSENCNEKERIEQCFGIKILVPKKGIKSKLMHLAVNTAKESLKSTFSLDQNKSQFAALTAFLNLEVCKEEQRIACFDISHHAGESAIASCIVWGKDGFEKQNYRKINIMNVPAGDDYAAMSQALEKYFLSERSIRPDILLIDGGKGQLNIAHKLLEKLAIKDIVLMSIAKGFRRKPGLEKVYIYQNIVHLLDIPPESPAFHFLLRIRDEAHRFAIGTHRKKQSQKRKTSLLENIPGIGPKKRQAILYYLGGLQEIKRASFEQLQKVPGINRSLAEKIYQFFHRE